MNFKNNHKILIIMAVVLLLVVSLVTGIIVGRKTGSQTNKDSAVSTENSTLEIPSESSEKDSSLDSDSLNKTSDPQATDEKNTSQQNLYEVVLNPSNSWEQDGKFVTQFDIDFRNNSGKTVNEWTIMFDGVSDAEVLSGWNGKFEIKNGQITITPESYNSSVESGTAVNVGVQLAFSHQENAAKMSKTAELYIAGNKVDTTQTASHSDDNSKGNAAPNDTGNDNATPNDTGKKNSSNKKNVKAESGTPFANHGALSVKGTDIVDKNGNKYQLKGVSTHGLAWFPDYVNKEAFETFRDDWGANVIRLAMYTDENGGYCTDGNKENLKELVKKGIDEATSLGMFVIVDWHILHDLTPLKYEDEAKKFFEEISSEYKNSDNIIYEICNEPNGGTGWSDIKKYAEDIIPIIRANDSNAIIVIGTPTWSQDVDAAANDPIKNYDNIMYTLHFYAATHKEELRKKLTTAKNSGLPIFITEFSICEASGNGSVDYDSAAAWFDLINDNNLSYCAWNVSNKDEKSSLIKSSVSAKSGWKEDDLSETGVWIRQQMR